MNQPTKITPTKMAILSVGSWGLGFFWMFFAASLPLFLNDFTTSKFVIAIPISLGGLGLREVSTVGLLVWMGADPQAALTLSLVFLAVSWISVIPGVFTAVHYGFRSFTPEDQTHAS